MTPYAIMTPGGIADQFTRGLSGVAQAFAQRSAIDRQAKQDALAQARQEQDDIRAAEYLALAQQDRERQAANALTAEADRKRRIEREDADYALKQVALNPNKFTGDPVHGGYAARLLEEESRKRQLEDLARMKYRAEAVKGFGEGMVKAREGLLGKTPMRTLATPKPTLPPEVVGAQKIIEDSFINASAYDPTTIQNARKILNSYYANMGGSAAALGGVAQPQNQGTLPAPAEPSKVQEAMRLYIEQKRKNQGK